MSRKDDSKYLEPLMCPECDESKIYIGVRALNYVTRTYSVDFKCGAGHEWTESEEFRRI